MSELRSCSNTEPSTNGSRQLRRSRNVSGPDPTKKKGKQRTEFGGRHCLPSPTEFDSPPVNLRVPIPKAERIRLNDSLARTVRECRNGAGL